MAVKDKKPEIRFTGFTDAWEPREFSDIFNLSQGLQIEISKRFVNPGENMYFYITNEFLKSDSNERYYIYNPPESVLCDENDILMTRTGNTGIVVTDVKGCYHNNFFKIQYESKDYDKYFICNYLSTPNMQKKILNSAGSSTIPDLSHKSFYKLVGSFPDIIEQKNISDFLINLDNLITLHQRKYDKLVIVKKFMLEKMFPKDGANVPEIRFKGFTGVWEQNKLNYYIETSNEKNVSNSFTKNDVLSVSGEFGIVNQIEFQGRSFAGVSVSNYGIVNIGDIVYTKSPLKANPYGIIKTNKRKAGIVSTLYAIYHPKEMTNSNFVQYYFESDYRLNRYLKPLVNKGAKNDMKVTNDNALLGLVIFPSYDEQTKIAGLFEHLDHFITLHQRELEKLKNIKKSMLEKMFVQEV
ncbi:MAG TPA: restriction endonuclease subunit S [Firmicutes bacterium]|jgi:type I restriction enzyme, S subunit|nr:restriction endonuclease subunit S [Bacillota bacterium]